MNFPATKIVKPMTRRIRRTQAFDAILEVSDPNFLPTPRPSQRNWLLNRALDELVDELNHSDESADRFVPGGDYSEFADRTNFALSDDEIMEDWQIPVMRRMAQSIGSSGHLLEVGFGRGIAADYLQEFRPARHTIIECNESVVQRFETWKTRYPDRDIQLLFGRWQDVADELESYDGILFHTYPLDQDELIAHLANCVTFAQPFFSVASRHLNPGGRFAYFTNEVDSLSRAHQRLLHGNFDSYTAEIMRDLEIPDETQDVLWARSLVLVTASRRGSQS